ncbi:MAG: carboxypeptidase regulatory-like domain-containing protein [Candidatus Zixiibacteriota bacterium]|nr:MAG: carboxypeptidase regulatory-like domain-containing protein [candidate division Zixibacteria bacterium]
MIASQKGMTLIELVMVIIIIGILAGIAMKSMDSAIEAGRFESTRKELNHLARAIVGNPDLVNNGSRIDFGYVGDVGALPASLDELVAAPGGYSTWRGPYISSDFVQSGDDYKTDAWGVEYAYTGLTITSTGSGSNITKQLAGALPDLTANVIRGTVLDAEGLPPGAQSGSVEISLNCPDGAGSTVTTTVNPSAGGNYNLPNIPIGTHSVTAVNTTTGDTVISYVTVSPRSQVVNNIRFGYALWGGGGGSGGGGLEYVAGSATTANGGRNIEFQISNSSASDITVSWLEAVYVCTPDAYYERVRWNGGTVANETDPRFASGDRAVFGGSRVLSSGSTATIWIQNFNTAQYGAGSNADVSGTTFTVTFSDGSEIIFTV